MRDPSGTLPCLYCVRDAVLLCASDVALLVDTGLVQPRIDWDALARLLYVNDLPVEDTAIFDVRELLAGSMIEICERSVEIRNVWSPWVHAQGQPCPSQEELAATIQSTIGCWASCFDQNIVAVSGGLDSSIVAHGLCMSDARVTGVTISTDDAYGDEAEFAARLCAHLNLPLDCRRYELQAVDIDRSSVTHLPRPGGRAQLQAFERALDEAAAVAGAEAFFSGVGGDNVFYFSHSARPLVDRYLMQGPGPGLLSTWRDISRLTESSWADVLSEALSVPRRPGPKYRWRADRRFLPSERTEILDAEPLSHPWLEGPPYALPGKAAQISMLVRAQRYIDGYDPRRPWSAIYPLLSQPVVECCLRIPSWRCCEGGRDRSFARSAFADALPPSVIKRHTKGGPDAFAHQILRQHLPGIRERLLDGLLSRNNILDRDAIERALSEQAMQHGTDYVRLLLLLDTEAWARHWSAVGSGAAL